MRKIKVKTSITNYKEILETWDFEKNIENPENISVWSKEKYWWKCKEGHSWQTSPEKRKIGRGCHYCTHQKVLLENSVAIKNPEILKEWNYNKNIGINPEEVNFGSKEIVWWKCKNGHEWQRAIVSRVSGERNCPYCAHQKLIPENSLAFLYPEISKQWSSKNNVKPEEVFAKTSKKFLWVCEKNHEWESSVSRRTRQKSGCPYCTNQKVNEENSLKTNYPEVAKQWDYEKNNFGPEDVTSGSEKRVWWKCEKGHIWKALVLNRTHGSGCPYCWKIQLLDGTICDSYIEAYYYILLKDANIKFEYNKKYEGEKRKKFDFYINEIDTYIEVTGFTKDLSYSKEQYVRYLRNIVKKKRKIIKDGHNFCFIQKNISGEEKDFVRENMVKKV